MDHTETCLPLEQLVDMLSDMQSSFIQRGQQMIMSQAMLKRLYILVLTGFS